MFGPDVSTSDRATIGGMIGNNSAGARSLRYGKTVDHVHAVEVVLADGTTATLGPVKQEELESVCSRGDSIGAIHRLVRDTVARARAGDPRSIPQDSAHGSAATTSTSSCRACRSGPSGFDDEPWRFNLAKLIVGSEGTLAVADAAVLKLVPAAGSPGSGRAFLCHDTGSARPLERDRRDRTGRRRDARPDDSRPRGGKPAVRRVSQFRRGPARRRAGGAVLRRLAGGAGSSAPALLVAKFEKPTGRAASAHPTGRRRQG